MVSSLFDLCVSTTVELVKEHLHGCHDICRPDAPCCVMESIGTLPQRIKSTVIYKVQLDLLNYEPESTPFYFSSYVEFLCISKPTYFCLQENCQCECWDLKLSKLHKSLSFQLSRCDCPFCLSKDICKRYWDYPQIHERIFMYSPIFGHTLTSLHVSSLCSSFIDHIHKFKNLSCFHIYPTTKTETSSFTTHFDDLIRGLQCSESLHQLHLVCNFLHPTPVSESSIKAIRKLNNLTDLYFAMEKVSPNVAAFLIRHLKKLKKFGICNWIGSSPLREVYAMLRYRYDYKSWPQRLLWTAPVNVDNTPAELFDACCNINLLKAHRTDTDKIPKLGYIDIEGNFVFLRRIFQSRPILSDTILFMEVYGCSITSVNLVLRNSTVKSTDIADIIAMCQRLNRLYISVGEILHKEEGSSMAMRFWNEELREFELSSPKGSDKAIVDITAMVVGSCPRVERIRLAFELFAFTQRDISKIFRKPPKELKCFLLDNKSNNGMEPILVERLVTVCPLLEKIGYLHKCRPNCASSDCDICMNAVIAEYPGIKFLKCSERQRIRSSTARWRQPV